MNKKIMTGRKLVLSRETVRRLTSAELESVAGGKPKQTIVTQCDCASFTCTDPVPISRIHTACTTTDMSNGTACP
ncbi:MAG TPA: class I lanthipeptide [Kofleriaceae bacterium]|nr:class I lanthipeptide [Kofleriaceae bacterium]